MLEKGREGGGDMTHLAWAARKGRNEVECNNAYFAPPIDAEFWEDGQGSYWQYNRTTKRWLKIYLYGNQRG